MKKTLVAVAALAFVGVASAQSTVTLSGSIDASVGKNQLKQTGAFNGSAAANVGANVNSGTQNGSRWGMSGTEDLGGGMAAIFNIVSGFNVDKGSSAQGGLLFGRQAWAGLKGGFGQVSLGRHETIMANGPWAITGGYANYDAWANTTANGGFGNAGSIATDNVRKNDSVQYLSPNMGGFQAKLMWAPGENGVAGGRGPSTYWSLGLDYYNGPIGLTFAYERDKVLPTVGAAATLFAVTFPASNAVASFGQTQWGLGASYDLGVVKLMGSIDRASLSTADDRGYALGLSAPLGPVSLDFEYAREKTTVAGTFASKASAINLRVNYPLSKRTKFYTLISDGNSSTAVAGSKQSLSRFQVGMRHVF